MTNDNTTTLLSDDEERRFAELFNETSRLQLTEDWESTLRAAIRAERSSNEPTDFLPADPDVAEINVSRTAEEPEPSFRAYRFLAAACLAMLVGVSVLALARVTGSENAEVELLAPEREIEPPAVQDLDVPEGTRQITPTDDGILAVTQHSNNDATILLVLDDNGNWVERSSLPMINAQVAVDGNRWVAVGVDTATLDEHPGVAGSAMARALLTAVSEDAGRTWNTEVVTAPDPVVPENMELTGFPDGTRTIITNVSLATHEDVAAIMYDTVVSYDLTDLARSNGLIGADDEVVFVQEGAFDVTPYSVGPGGFGPIDIPAAALDTSVPGRDTLYAHTTRSKNNLVLSTAGGAFEDAQLPGPFGNDPFGFGEWRSGTLRTDEGGLLVSDVTGGVTYRSTDGTDWARVDADDISATVEIRDDWTVSQGGGEARQSVAGSALRPIPVPSEGTVVAGLAPTDFGAAVVWQDVPSVVRGALGAQADIDGWEIESPVTGARIFTSPDGSSFTPTNGTGEFDGGWVVTDLHENIQIFNEAGERELLVEPGAFVVDVEDLRAAEQFVGWSTDGEDWKFAAIESLEPGLWRYESTPAGLLGTEVFRHDSAVLIEWPDEFNTN